MTRRGFAIIYSLVLGALMLLIASASFIIAFNGLAAANAVSKSAKAYYVAEAGVTKKFMQLREGSTSSLSENFSIGSAGSGNYYVTVTVTQPGAFVTYRIDSAGTYKGVTRRISVTVRQISCARYAYLSNNEDQLFWWGSRPIWFVTGDRIRGPLHTNDQLNISEDPIFEGPVSSTASSINYYHGGPPLDNPEFLDSLTLGASDVQLPASTEILTNISTAAQQSGGLYLNGNSAIVLLPDGSMNITNSDREWDNKNMPLPGNGAVYVNNGYVDISGILNGQLTLGTNRSIYIVNNLLYHVNPRVDPSSTDIMGLVAQNNVYIDRYAPYNVEADGYIVALNTSFGVENYDSGLKGILTLYGGMSQERRGPVGTFNAVTGERISGYSKNYNYDDRLRDAAPLYFPLAKDANGRVVYLKTSYSES